MKTLLALLILCSRLCAGNLTLDWDDDLNIVGTVTYSIYTSDATGTEQRIATGIIGKTLTLDAPGSTLTYWVTAVTLDGIESQPSDTLRVTVPFAPGAPAPRRRIALQSSADLQTWTTVAAYEVPEVNRAFYRIAFTQ